MGLDFNITSLDFFVVVGGYIEEFYVNQPAF